MAKAEDYIEDVQRYDAGASIDHVKKIVNHLGIALSNRDSSLVSATDQVEKDRIRDGFAAKKLGLDADAGAALVDKVCEQMSGDRMKQRVTFYYLMAKHAGKLGDL